jgi:hypothetical protein
MSKRDPNNHVRIGEVISDKDSNVVYNIGVDKKISEQYKHAHLTCTCPAFRFSGKGGKERHCKHTVEFANENYFTALNQDLVDRLKKLQDILGWILKTDPRTKTILLESKVNQSSISIALLLTEIICPRIMCSHVMRGNFKAGEPLICEKCNRGFMT